MSVHLVASLEEFSQLESDWNALLEKSCLNNVFLTWQWQYIWASCFINYPRQIFVLCVREEHELIAIAPWYMDIVSIGPCKIREIRFQGGPQAGSDYLNILILRGQEKLATQAIYKYLFGVGFEYWDQIRLSNLQADSPFLQNFLSCLEVDGKYYELGRSGYLPRTILPEDEDEYFNSLSANRRYIYRRDQRRLSKEGTLQHITYTGNDVTLERFFLFYNSYSGYSDGPDLEKFLKMLCRDSEACSWISIDFLTVNTTDVGALLHVQYNNSIHMLKMVINKTFSKRVSIGNLIVGTCISKAIKSKKNYYDFLKGDEEYKFHWSNEGRVTLSIMVSQKKIIPVILAVISKFKDIAKLVMR